MSVDTKIETKYGSYNERNLSALIRRNMMTKEHKLKNKYTRKQKHKNTYDKIFK